jgi:hypothetical protein
VSTATDVLDDVATRGGHMAAEQTISRWEGNARDFSSIFGRDGRSVSESAARNHNSPRFGGRYDEYLAEAARLYRRVLQGDRRAAIDFREAMSTSDFPNLFADILDRQILANYNTTPVSWEAFARRGTVRDFRQVKRFTLDGGMGVLGNVGELGEYPMASLTDGGYSYKVSKFGRRMGLDWEDLINDDLDAFRDLPMRLGVSARRTEEFFATGLFASSTGPNSTYFASANKNIVTTGTLNPSLSISALQAAFTVLASQVDPDGGPIIIDGVTLVVPPALIVPANNIMNATQIWTAAGSGGASSDAGRGDRLNTVNWMANKVKVVSDPWLPIIDTTHGNTGWYLFADPGVGRPAMEVGFLQGHEVPDTFQKLPNQQRVGGGAAAPEDGDFETDRIDWKVRHVIGGTLMDVKAGFASNGTGS